MTKILVKKKKGYVEDFDINKIKESLLKAGCKLDEAEEIGKEIKKWAEKQPRSMVHSFEIEKQIINHTKDKHKDILISFLFYAKNKIKPIKRVFSKKDIAQMLTSLFVIIQVYSQELIKISFFQGLSILTTSFLTCMTILYFTEGKQMWKHVIFGFTIVSLLAMIVGTILESTVIDVIIAISVGLPVAAMVDVIGSREQ